MSDIAKLLANSTEVGQLASDLAVLARMAGVSNGGRITREQAIMYSLSPGDLIRHAARCLLAGIELPDEEIRKLNEQAQTLRMHLKFQVLAQAPSVKLDGSASRASLLEGLLAVHYTLEAILADDACSLAVPSLF